MTDATNTTLLLADGAMLSGTPLAQSLGLQDQGVAIYADIGQRAASVGPWLVPFDNALDLGALPLPERLGVSVMQSACSVDELFRHLHGLRTVTMEDGQAFYLRCADTRALTAMMKAWPDTLLARVKGPIRAWQWIDRHGRLAAFAPDLPGDCSPMPPISLAQFEALVRAGEADRLAAELQGLDEAGLQPCRDGGQFALVEQALSWCSARGFNPWWLRLVVARQAVHSGGRALGNAAFALAAQEAQQAGGAGPLQRWLAAQHAAGPAP